MLSIQDFSGNNLLTTPPDSVSLPVLGNPDVPVTLQCRVLEDNPALLNDLVSGTLNWNDGSRATVYAPVAGTLTIDVSRFLPPGDYTIQVYGRNYLAPVPQSVLVNFHVVVSPDPQSNPPDRLIFGPVLPRDVGFPDGSQWQFQIDSDLKILESSVKMLLLTARGERLAEPDYGTDLHRIIFETNSSALEPLIQEAITTALVRWEPRVGVLEPLVVTRSNDRSVTVIANFISKLSRQTFESQLQFVR